MIRAKEIRDVDPPLWVAWHQALAGIRVRFLRQALTSVGIMLGTAFFASMQTLRVTEATASGADDMAQARLLWLSATSLVMCLVGVTNAMLMSVAERFREIGTIKCLGAPDGFIVKVFFMEAMLIGLVGSIAGSILGSALMGLVLTIGGFDVPASGVAVNVLISILVGVVVTVLAAIAPAVQAAKMPAAAALRVEV